MPAFLIHQPKCVFIHNPKTGGQALRQVLMQGEFEGPVNGRLPDEWTRHYSFAFVRNPFDRLVSAWKMFSEGVEDTGWRIPLDLKPGMSLAEFLEIVVDETIGYGESERAGKIRIRNHTLPQCHEYYAVDQAEFVGRFESYEEDSLKVFKRLGLPPIPPDPRHVTVRGPYQEYFDKATRAIAGKFYAEDLNRFGYRFEE